MVLLIFSLSCLANEAPLVAEDPVLEKRMLNLAENLRCLVCQNESLAGSRSDFANDLRREIREQMQANKSDDEITAFLVARYGDFVLYDPPMKSTTWLLWFGPFIFFLGGVVTLIVYLKRRRSQLQNSPLTDHQRRQIESLMEVSDKNKDQSA
ncbi:MAG: cytochrome c-type biogenesis protein [Nitrosomonas sp.]|nr:cytochrome c-type biogenesis protein [Nitrosomonas sp.]